MTTQNDSARLSVTAAIGHSLTRALAGPLAILVLIPVLVCTVALTITLVSWSGSRRNIERLAVDHFTNGTELLHWQVEQMLMQGKAVLGALHAFVGRHGTDFEDSTFAAELADQFGQRPAIAFLGMGDPDGHYTGIYARDSGDDQRDLVLTVRRMQPGGKSHMRDYLLTDRGPEQIRNEPESGYDPRKRGWYLMAAREKQRIITDPYPWFDSGLIGVTVADPVFTTNAVLRAVVEVDFDLNSLSRQVEIFEQRYGTRIMIHTHKGEVLALPGFRQAAGQNREGRGDIPRVESIADPLFRRYFAQATAVVDPTRTHVDLEMNGERFLAVSRPIDVPGETLWHVVCIGSLDGMLRTAQDSMRRNVIVSLLAMLIATGIASLFARYIVATHVRANRAEQDARKARQEAREMGAYRFKRLLGEGGMGEVWVGEHRLLARPVAIKLIHAQRAAGLDEQTRRTYEKRFEREAKALARLQSPHTIQIFDFGVSESGNLFFVMELLDGIDLRHLVRTFGKQSPERVRRILEGAASSLSEAHAQGLIHRDIKPANIFLCRQADHYDLVKVLDFGMVHQAGAGAQGNDEPVLTMQGALSGTPAYMAPEQASGQEADIDARADIYALALVGWYLLTGHDLFGRETQMASLLAQAQDAPPSLQDDTDLSVPPAMEALLRSCLAKSPDDRPASMSDLVIRLRELRSVTDPNGEEWDETACRTWWQQVPPPDFSEDDSPESRMVSLHHRARVDTAAAAFAAMDTQ